MNPHFGLIRVRHHSRMSRSKSALLDTGLIVAGAALSALFISTDGNGQNPLPVVAGMLLVVFITGLVSFGLAWFIRSVPFAVMSSVVITDLLFVLYFVSRVAYSRRPRSRWRGGISVADCFCCRERTYGFAFVYWLWPICEQSLPKKECGLTMMPNHAPQAVGSSGGRDARAPACLTATSNHTLL